MIGDVIWIVLVSIVFYFVINKVQRLDELKKYDKDARSRGVYSESYRSLYSSYLRGQCIFITMVFVSIMISNKFIGSIESLIIGITIGMILKPVFKRCYPKPE